VPSISQQNALLPALKLISGFKIPKEYLPAPGVAILKLDKKKV
jgi:hypothetical protein